MADPIYQQHLEDDNDTNIQLVQAAKEIAWNNIKRRGIYKHLDGVTYDYIVSEYLLALTTPGSSGAKLSGVDQTSLTTLFGANVQQIIESIDFSLGGLLADSLNRFGTITSSANQNMGSNRITGLADPTEGADAANREYVDLQGGVFSQAINFDGVDLIEVDTHRTVLANASTNGSPASHTCGLEPGLEDGQRCTVMISGNKHIEINDIVADSATIENLTMPYTMTDSNGQSTVSFIWYNNAWNRLV